MQRLFRQFSFPGGVPSHVAPETPGSIHEGGELGYSLSHAFGAAFDNPDLVVACVVGDGEAETGPLATSWHSNKFLDPVGDGAVLPILHLNGYKIANPTVLARISEEELTDAARRLRMGAVSRGRRRSRARAPAARGDARPRARRDPRDPTPRARRGRHSTRARWPMIVLADAEGLDRAEGGRRPAGRGNVARASGAARRRARRSPSTSRALEAWMRSYRPEELFDDAGRPRAEIVDWLPRGGPAHGREPARQRGPAAARSRAARLPRLRRRGARARASPSAEATRVLGQYLRDVFRLNADDARLPAVRPRRDRVEPARRGVRSDAEDVGGRDPAGRRRARARRPGDGDPLGDHVPGLARGLPADRPARPVLVLRGVHAHRRLDVQPAREVAEGRRGRCRGGGRSRR